MFAVANAIANLELSDEPHLARLLILLNAISHKKQPTVEGITKLAKLDFLLRYPNCLARALLAEGKNPKTADTAIEEANTIESKMIRFRYGPWDARYRRWIGLLVAKGLGTTYIDGRTIHVGLTEKGRDVATQLASYPEYQVLAKRSTVVMRSFSGFSAVKLKDFIYRVFPEIINMKWGEEIEI